MRLIDVRFTIKDYLPVARETILVEDVNDDKEIKAVLNDLIKQRGLNSTVKNIIFLEVLK
jgi:hypothetical protein